MTDILLNLFRLIFVYGIILNFSYSKTILLYSSWIYFYCFILSIASRFVKGAQFEENMWPHIDKTQDLLSLFLHIAQYNRALSHTKYARFRHTLAAADGFMSSRPFILMRSVCKVIHNINQLPHETPREPESGVKTRPYDYLWYYLLSYGLCANCLWCHRSFMGCSRKTIGISWTKFLINYPYHMPWWAGGKYNKSYLNKKK